MSFCLCNGLIFFLFLMQRKRINKNLFHISTMGFLFQTWDSLAHSLRRARARKGGKNTSVDIGAQPSTRGSEMVVPYNNQSYLSQNCPWLILKTVFFGGVAEPALPTPKWTSHAKHRLADRPSICIFHPISSLFNLRRHLLHWLPFKQNMILFWDPRRMLFFKIIFILPSRAIGIMLNSSFIVAYRKLDMNALPSRIF